MAKTKLNTDLDKSVKKQKKLEKPIEEDEIVPIEEDDGDVPADVTEETAEDDPTIYTMGDIIVDDGSPDDDDKKLLASNAKKKTEEEVEEEDDEIWLEDVDVFPVADPYLDLEGYDPENEYYD